MAKETLLSTYQPCCVLSDAIRCWTIWAWMRMCPFTLYICDDWLVAVLKSIAASYETMNLLVRFLHYIWINESAPLFFQKSKAKVILKKLRCQRNRVGMLDVLCLWADQDFVYELPKVLSTSRSIYELTKLPLNHLQSHTTVLERIVRMAFYLLHCFYLVSHNNEFESFFLLSVSQKWPMAEENWFSRGELKPLSHGLGKLNLA